jgi:hypothetical protein
MVATDLHVRFPAIGLLSRAEFAARRRADQDRLDARHLHETALPTRNATLVLPGTCALCLRRTDYTSETAAWDRLADGRRVPRWDEALVCDCSDALPKQARAIVHFAESAAMLRPWTRLLLFGPPDPCHRRLAALAGSTVTVPALRVEGGGFGLGAAPAAFQLAVAVGCLHRTPPLDAAFAAFRRVLAPGGSLLFTVPFHHDAARTVSRTDIRLHDGRLPAMLREPAHEIGWDVLERLRGAGFAHAAAHWYWSAELGYLGAFSMIFHAAL